MFPSLQIMMYRRIFWIITTFSFYFGVLLQPPQAGPLQQHELDVAHLHQGEDFGSPAYFVYNDLDVQYFFQELQENAPLDFESTTSTLYIFRKGCQSISRCIQNSIYFIDLMNCPTRRR